MAIKRWEARFKLNMDASREVKVYVNATTETKAKKYAIEKCIKDYNIKSALGPDLLDIKEVEVKS